jgi:hypothetical protein
VIEIIWMLTYDDASAHSGPEVLTELRHSGLRYVVAEGAGVRL